MRTFLHLISFILIALQASAQTIQGFSERIALHTNANLFLTGETIYFDLVCIPGQRQASQSQIAYVEVVGSERKPVLQAKVLLTKHKGHGDFFLSSKIGSGNYTIVAYTQWVKNTEPEAVFRKEITIINPFRIQKEAGFTTGDGIRPVGIATTDTAQVQLILSARTYPTRSKITVNIASKVKFLGPPSVSVHAKPTQFSSTPDSHHATTTKAATSVPELRGKLISGIVKVGDRPLAQSIMLISIPGVAYALYTTKTDSAGRFAVVIEPVSGKHRLIIQPAGTLTPQTNITLDPEYMSHYAPFTPSPFRFNPDVARILERRSIHAQIENAFYELKHDSIQARTPVRFYKQADKIYFLDAYTRFPTMEDVFREYVTEVIVRKSKDQFDLRTMDGKTRLPMSEAPLILLDGVVMKDIQDVMKYDPLQLKKIEVVTRKYFLGPAVFNGIISLETYQGDVKNLSLPPELQFEWEGVQPQKIYMSPNYQLSDGLDRIPDYRIQLAWEPDVRLIDNAGSITFFASDVAGEFEVILEGITTDGSHVVVSKTLTITDGSK